MGTLGEGRIDQPGGPRALPMHIFLLELRRGGLVGESQEALGAVERSQEWLCLSWGLSACGDAS